MNRRFKNCRSESGIALVITLIMLAIVTLMAIVFLALARRERASVQVVQDLATAEYMADAALERAKAQAIAQMAVAGSKLSYDLFVSTNFISPIGFVPQGSREPDPSNVSYVYENGRIVTGDDRLQVIRNLQYDPRAPVFITTNENENFPKDFRYFLDFDRNRVFETNGILPEIDNRGFAITDANGNIISNRFVGDPEWIGVLEKPNEAHSESNRFIGRIAYIALPAGKTLSLNNIHNHANREASDATDDRSAANGFMRHQGYGSWELNLAGFLRELNTNEYAWGSNSYFMPSPLTTGLPAGDAFNNARAFLDFRYNGTRDNLYPASALFANNAQEFTRDGIDNYSDGPLLMNASLGFNTDNDNPDLPWPGSPTTNGFYDVQEFFTFGSYSDVAMDFTNRLNEAMLIRPGKRSSYDQYTFYRLLSQMGVDSTPYIKGKLHLNYTNHVGQISTNLAAWASATNFFMQAADLMLKTSIVENIIPLNHLGFPATRGQQVMSLYTNYVIGDTPVNPNLSITNIQVWRVPRTNEAYTAFLPNNEYSASVHRILQVAANIWDNMTNRWSSLESDNLPRLPTVFRPTFTKTATNVIISGFTEVIETSSLENTENPRDWVDFETFFTSSTFQENTPYPFVMMYGQPWVIGTKKGHPNFNEFSVESDVAVTRRLELLKSSPGGPVTDTNVLYTISIENIWGIEGWNSYLADYTNRNIEIFADVASQIVLSNRFGAYTTAVRWATNYAATNLTLTDWPGTKHGVSGFPSGNFKIPIHTSQLMLTNAVWLTNSPYFTSPVQGQVLFQDLQEAPRLELYTTNRVRYWMLDKTHNKVVDFVTLDHVSTRVDLDLAVTNTPATLQFTDAGPVTPQMLWSPAPVSPGSPLTVGITNQIAVSFGDPTTYDQTWKSFSTRTGDKRRAIDAFRRFIGLPLLFTYDYPDSPPNPRGPRYEAPFTPTWRRYARDSFAADDPLVHYTATDLQSRNPVRQYVLVTDPLPANSAGYTGNLGQVNERYGPWGQGGAAYDMSLKDPGIWSSDSWDFPIDRDTRNYFRYPSIGWLGQVHRGSPWQTVYLKSAPPLTNNAVTWAFYRGTLGTHPVKDWRLLDVFTVAPNEAAASGLLSVNQTNSAAWAAVLAGLPQTIIANSTPIAQDNPPQYSLELIEPASPGLDHIVDSINRYRATSTLKTNWVQVGNAWQGQVYTNGVFESLGHVLGAPGLSRQSPYLMQATNGVSNPWARITNHVNYAWTDRIVEQIPMQILSLLQKDEPRFVVYAFGQALQPAPRSIETSAAFYGLCTNYQITGEVITKTTFRVEGELNNPANPLRTVVEDYKVLPPPE